MTSYRFSSWDGGEDVCALNGDTLMEHLSNQLVSHGHLPSVIRSLTQRGILDRNAYLVSFVD